MKEVILKFIYENFNNKRKLLKPKINLYLKNPEKSIRFANEFRRKIKSNFGFQSFASIKKYRKNNEVGDICDVWTFILNEDLKDKFDNVAIDKLEPSLDEYLASGKELHICKVWINWFMDVCFVQNIYEKQTKSIYENRVLLNLTPYEENLYKEILEILNNQNCVILNFPFLKNKIAGIQTDCAKNPTVFQCVFSDIIYPISNTKKTRKKIGDIEVILIEYYDSNLKPLKKEIMFGNGNINIYRIDFDMDNKIIKVLNNKEICKEEYNYGYSPQSRGSAS